jgi:putative nucleotidyltransferase with HDIG domain
MTDQNDLSQLKVLLVDDEENILRAITRLLMDEEFAILTASSGEEGIAVLKSTADVGLILSDQRMPGMSGAEFLEQARQVAPNAVRMVLTGYADVSAAVDAINKGGACRYLAKPWNDEMLVQSVREGVQLYRLAEENRRLNELVIKQNAELQEWNTNLRGRVLEQTAKIRQQNEELQQLTAEATQNYQNSILAFSGLIGLLDPLARHHSRNVTALAEGVARELGLLAAEVETVRIAALLHDIGEIGMDPAILRHSKEGMTDEQLAEYRQHPVRGQAVVDMVEGLRPAGVLIRHHHERFDGTGFPDELAGAAIPLGARIIAMADFIDSTIARLEARGAVEKALALAGERLGTVLDQQLFPLFTKQVQLHYQVLADREQMVEKELQPKDLRVGMVLAREVTSGTGLLLLGKGVTLDEGRIESLKRYYRLDPPQEGIFVLLPR